MSTRPWFLAAGAAVVATAATIAAFAVIGDDASTTSSTPAPADAPSRATAPSKTKSTSAAGEDTSATPSTQAVPVYYVGETGQGPRLYREFHRLPTAPVDDAVAQALNEAVSATPEDPDYKTLWPEGAKVDNVEKSGDTLVVDLTGASMLRDRPAGMSKEEAQISVDQLVYTVQAGYQGEGPVRFQLDGQITDQLLGVPVAEPLARPDDMTSLAQVWIISPGEDDTVKSPFKVKGVGSFFEANVVWELRKGDKVVASSAKSGPVMAEECCTMAPYEFTVKADPGNYTLVVSDEDASGGEGPKPFQDTKDITVR
jgi:hypothetical protein